MTEKKKTQDAPSEEAPGSQSLKNMDSREKRVKGGRSQQKTIVRSGRSSPNPRRANVVDSRRETRAPGDRHTAGTDSKNGSRPREVVSCRVRTRDKRGTILTPSRNQMSNVENQDSHSLADKNTTTNKPSPAHHITLANPYLHRFLHPRSHPRGCCCRCRCRRILPPPLESHREAPFPWRRPKAPPPLAHRLSPPSSQKPQQWRRWRRQRAFLRPRPQQPRRRRAGWRQPRRCRGARRRTGRGRGRPQPASAPGAGRRKERTLGPSGRSPS